MSGHDDIDWAAASAAFDRLLVPTMFQPSSQEVVDRTNLQPAESVLDIGCGTGPASILAAERVLSAGKVVALDPQPAMLAVGAAKTLSNKAAGIEWMEGDAHALQFDDSTFDVIICCHVLQHLSHPNKALSEIYRVLKPGGRFATCCWRHFDHCPAYGALIRGMAKQSDISPEEVHAATGFRLGDAEKLRTMVEGSGLSVISVEAIDKSVRFKDADGFIEGVSRGGPFTRKSLDEYEEASRNAIFQDVRDALEMYQGADSIIVPFAAHFLTAHK